MRILGPLFPKFPISKNSKGSIGVSRSTLALIHWETQMFFGGFDIFDKLLD
jgi:hypothetical protein